MKSRYKVYILDEVHMLSPESFNALLKTLEEPPHHVVFIMATTELHKIPETIASRCQVFTFKKFNAREIAERLAHILEKEQIAFERDALLPIAERGEGSLRDAISLLDPPDARLFGQRCADPLRCARVSRYSADRSLQHVCAGAENR